LTTIFSDNIVCSLISDGSQKISNPTGKINFAGLNLNFLAPISPQGMMVSPKFKPIKQQKISTKIVEQIKALIKEGDLKPGDALPPERELED